jgi:hypothetical protein
VVRGALLLAHPSALAGISRGRARAFLGILLLALLASLSALDLPSPDRGAAHDGQSDILLYSGIIEGVRHCSDYYGVAAEALRGGGYPLQPFVAMRLPTLAVVAAAVPPRVVRWVLWGLAVAVALAWYARVAPMLARMPARVLAMLLLVAGMAAALQAPTALFHETWAGLLVALSLALRRSDRATEAIALGLAAVLIRETAGLYLLIMGLLAWRDGCRREAIGWAAALAVAAVVIAFHAHAVAEVVRPLDPVSPGWTGLLGPGFATRALAASTGLAALPLWLAALLVPLAVSGWTAWRDPLAVRTFATLAAYLALLMLFSRADNFYWVLMITPMSLVGLIFAPDALRDLASGALDRRRITVRRVAR